MFASSEYKEEEQSMSDGTSGCEKRNKPEMSDEMIERLCVHRLQEKKRQNELLSKILDRAGEDLNRIHLRLGPRLRWKLPWLRWRELRLSTDAEGKSSLLHKEAATSSFVSCATRGFSSLTNTTLSIPSTVPDTPLKHPSPAPEVSQPSQVTNTNGALEGDENATPVTGLNPDFFIVEKILDHKRFEDFQKTFKVGYRGYSRSSLFYLVKWKGYSARKSTWEPYQNLCHIPLLHEYNAQNGLSLTKSRKSKGGKRA